MMYANPTDLHAAIRSWDTLRREVGSEEEEEEEEEGDVKGEKSMMGMVGFIFFLLRGDFFLRVESGVLFFFFVQLKMRFFFFLLV